MNSSCASGSVGTDMVMVKQGDCRGPSGAGAGAGAYLALEAQT